MVQHQIEKTLEILKHSHELSNISSELENRIPKKHHEMFTDLIIDIEKIADQLIYLEDELYYEYLSLNDLEKKDNKDSKQITTSLTEHIIGDMVNKKLEKE